MIMPQDKKRPGGAADPGAAHGRHAGQSSGRGEADESTGPAPDDHPAPTGTEQDYDKGKTREAEAREYAPGGLVRPDERYSGEQQYGQADKSGADAAPSDAPKGTRLRLKSDRD
jgi:hypothetical protein